MKLGLTLGTFIADPSRPLASASRAAAAGFDAVFASDHLFPPGSPGRPALEPFTLLAAAAAANPGLGTGVLVTRPGMRPVGMLAKEAASLDLMTGGRAILGLGLGDANGRLEHEALGLEYPPARERAELLAETLGALRSLFEGRSWGGGRLVGPASGPLLPLGSPKVWVGGAGDRALSVAARFADGWNGWGLSTEVFAERSSTLARLAGKEGRDPAEVEPTWAGIVLAGENAADLARLEEEREAKGLPMDVWRGTVAHLAEFAEDLAAHGCAWMVCLPAGPSDRLELIARTLRG
jgi:alkanesulfonate monooxygenase SsuD/methylene tetrahydromethanopterin reductase-like flavin-dependent oxidoreductase (luciferase family)